LDMGANAVRCPNVICVPLMSNSLSTYIMLRINWPVHQDSGVELSRFLTYMVVEFKNRDL
jgi:hypothetical protein